MKNEWWWGYRDGLLCAPAQAGSSSAEQVRREALFLCDRLADFSSDLAEETVREWYGHVEPSINRLRALVERPEPQPATWETRRCRGRGKCPYGQQEPCDHCETFVRGEPQPEAREEVVPCQAADNSSRPRPECEPAGGDAGLIQQTREIVEWFERKSANETAWEAVAADALRELATALSAANDRAEKAADEVVQQWKNFLAEKARADALAEQVRVLEEAVRCRRR